MKNQHTSRRRFLATCTAGAAAAAAGVGRAPSRLLAAADENAVSQSGKLSRLSPHLLVYHGPVNVGIVRDGHRALLIDCGDGSVADVLEGEGITEIAQMVFTHHHRDQACGAAAVMSDKTKVAVPAAERKWFDDVASYWNSPKSRWHVYNFHPHHLMLAESIRVDEALADGQTFAFGPAKIEVLQTPGHTNGSVSYVVQVDGRRVIFSGDCIYDEGQIWDIFSMQKGIPRGDRYTSDYHGFLGSRKELYASLERIKQAEPAVLVPSHGRIMNDPAAAVDRLIERMKRCYHKYVATSALRHYFPEAFAEFAGAEDHMPIRHGKQVPDCLEHFGTSWIIVSKPSRAAYVIDCGSPRVVDRLKEMLERGEITSVEGLWITHYHNDHVNGIPAFQEAFDGPCTTDRHVAEVVTNPMAWRLPCVSPEVARVDTPAEDGHSWQWREFKMTSYFLPGQTLYHAGLLVEGQGVRLFFVGDSFTMAGMDDYCAQNRNWLGRNVGFDYCLRLVEKLQPTHMFNCHVDDAFAFNDQERQFMLDNLAEREKLFTELVAWDHANYAMDEPWVRPFPYEQERAPGGKAALDVVLTNHSTAPRRAACRVVLPGRLGATVSQWTEIEIPAKSEGRAPLEFVVPADAQPGRYVVPIDVRYGDRQLPQFKEAIVVVG